MIIRPVDWAQGGSAASRDGARSLEVATSVLLPLIRGQSAASMLRIGDAIANQCRSRGIVLSLVEIPSRWVAVTSTAITRSRELLRWIAASDYRDEIDTARMRLQSRFTSDVTLSIREAILDAQCDLVLAEWPACGARRENSLRAILRTLVRNLETGLVVARPEPYAGPRERRPRNVLAALRGGPSAWLALSVARSLAVDAGARLTLLRVYDPGHHRERLSHEAAEFEELANAAADVKPRIVQTLDDDPPGRVLCEARRYDTVVLGAHADAGHRDALFGPNFVTVMDELPGTVIVVRRGAPVRAAA